jgi:hypothetical protein
MIPLTPPNSMEVLNAKIGPETIKELDQEPFDHGVGKLVSRGDMNHTSNPRVTFSSMKCMSILMCLVLQ